MESRNYSNILLLVVYVPKDNEQSPSNQTTPSSGVEYSASESNAERKFTHGCEVAENSSSMNVKQNTTESTFRNEICNELPVKTSNHSGELIFFKTDVYVGFRRMPITSHSEAV